jgi:CBS domain-containing protein
MPVPRFDEDVVRAISTSHSYARGQEYFESGTVSHLVLEEGVYRAEVHGRHRYSIRIWEGRSGLETHCTCTHSADHVCRHVVAAMLRVLRKKGSGEERRDFTWVGWGLPGAGKQAGSGPATPDGPGTVEAEAAGRDADQMPSGTGAADRSNGQNDDLRARQIMASPVVSLPPEASLYEAWKLICDRRFRHVPVVDGTGALMGIISDRDVLLRVAGIAASEGEDAAGGPTAVRDIMHVRVLTAGPDTRVPQIARMLLEERIGSMPIVDDTRTLVGIITRSDILRTLVGHDQFDP